MATAKKAPTKAPAAPIKPKKPHGRPSTYSRLVADQICDRIATGEPLRVICRDEGMPAWQTVYGWISSNPEFSERIARARELGFDAIAEQCLEIADEGTFDSVETDDGKLVVNHEVVQRSKLRVETRLKLLSKWSPKKYGERIQQEVGNLDDKPFKTDSNVTLSPSDAYKRMLDGD